jgi:hypothetical protein
MADEQQPPIGLKGGRLREGFARIEPAGQPTMDPQPVSQLRSPLLGGQLGGLASTRLRAEQNRIEARTQLCEREARRACLAFAALCQTTVGIGTCTVGLGLRMT